MVKIDNVNRMVVLDEYGIVFFEVVEVLGSEN